MTDPFSCSAASRVRDDPLPGTASTVRAFVWLEHPGPWGRRVLHDSALPGSLLTELRRRSGATGVRVQLIRRHGRALRSERPRVFAAFAHPTGSFVETTTLGDHRDALGLDFDALAQGRSPGLTPHPEPVFGVCTHGRHDACCATWGRPVAAALARSRPGQTWEVSHLGGDRFAANLLVLPWGLYFGRLQPETIAAEAARIAAGDIPLGPLRGRSCLPMPAQAAEIALAQRLGRLPLASGFEGYADGTALFRIDGVRWRVRVRERRGDPARLTCTASVQDRPRLFSVETIEALDPLGPGH